MNFLLHVIDIVWFPITVTSLFIATLFQSKAVSRTEEKLILLKDELEVLKEELRFSFKYDMRRDHVIEKMTQDRFQSFSSTISSYRNEVLKLKEMVEIDGKN